MEDLVMFKGSFLMHCIQVDTPASQARTAVKDMSEFPVTLYYSKLDIVIVMCAFPCATVIKFFHFEIARTYSLRLLPKGAILICCTVFSVAGAKQCI